MLRLALKTLKITLARSKIAATNHRARINQSEVTLNIRTAFFVSPLYIVGVMCQGVTGMYKKRKRITTQFVC